MAEHTDVVLRFERLGRTRAVTVGELKRQLEPLPDTMIVYRRDGEENYVQPVGETEIMSVRLRTQTSPGNWVEEPTEILVID